VEFASGSKKLKVKIGKELEERNKKWREKKKFKEQKESIKKVRKVWRVIYEGVSRNSRTEAIAK
jgi:hypothetical protein